MSADNKALVRRFVEFINKDDLAPIDEFFANTYVYHNPSMSEVEGFGRRQNGLTQWPISPFLTSSSR
jgi:hypothetical protein